MTTLASYPDTYDPSKIIGNGQGIPLDTRMGLKTGGKRKKRQTGKQRRKMGRRHKTRSRR